MQLQLSTWREIETYLERSQGIIVPIGSTEQHGPMGLIGTDALCAEIIAREVGVSVDAVVAPTISVGMAQFHLGFPGSISLQPKTLLAVLEDYVASLAAHGFSHFYFVNGHGGNVATASAAFQQIYSRSSYMANATDGPKIRCRLKSWWDNPTVDRNRSELYGKWEGFHATPSEIAITQHAFPGLARVVDMSEPVALSDAFSIDHNADEYYEAQDFRKRFPDGRVGSDSKLARPDDGRRIIAAAVQDIGVDYLAFLRE